MTASAPDAAPEPAQSPCAPDAPLDLVLLVAGTLHVRAVERRFADVV